MRKPRIKRKHLKNRIKRVIWSRASRGADDDLLTPDDLAKWFQVTPAWVHASKNNGNGPPHVNMTSWMVRYRRADVLEWLKSRTHRRTREVA